MATTYSPYVWDGLAGLTVSKTKFLKLNSALPYQLGKVKPVIKWLGCKCKCTCPWVCRVATSSYLILSGGIITSGLMLWFLDKRAVLLLQHPCKMTLLLGDVIILEIAHYFGNLFWPKDRRGCLWNAGFPPASQLVSSRQDSPAGGQESYVYVRWKLPSSLCQVEKKDNRVFSNID